MSFLAIRMYIHAEILIIINFCSTLNSAIFCHFTAITIFHKF